MKTLVAYYSRSGNTRFVAQKIAEGLDADLCEIVDKKNRNGKWGFLTGGYSAFREKLTEIEVTKSVEAYDLIIVGSPVWAGKITPAIRTFLVRENVSEKKLGFFVTLGGNKPEKALKSLRKIISPKLPIEELAIIDDLKNKEEVEEQVANWCKKIKT
jgi:flavodoxin